MKKKVVFTGCNTKLYTKAEILEVGKVYEVIDKQEKRLETLLFLKDVQGSFNEKWFEPYYETFFGYSHEVPKVGKYLEDFIRLNWSTKKLEKISKSSTTLQKVKKVDFNAYVAYTKTELYMLQIKPK